MPTWNAGQYLRFAGERTRPCRDLAAAVALDAPRRIVDLGCGPGNSTAVLAARWPDAEIVGLDSSEAMIAAARRDAPERHRPSVVRQHPPFARRPPGSPGEYGKLWVAAVDLDPAPGKDPSHPAFFLDGQELHADNLRGFWVLDPCKQNGSACTSGDECCNGFCRPNGDGGPLECVPPPVGGCSLEFEKCSTAADCCDAGAFCINGHCAKPPPK